MNPHDDALIYNVAASEIAGGNPDRGILAKAFSVAMGQQEKTKALYIQYRVEQLKAEAARQVEVETRQIEVEAGRRQREVRRRTLGRKAYLAELKEDFGYLMRITIPESPLTSDGFSGRRDSLSSPIPLSDVAEALEILEFRLIDAVKAGLLSGVKESNDEWWVSKNG